MSFLRTLPTRRLIVFLIAVLALGGGGAAIAVAAGGGGPKPAPKPLDQAIHDALAAPTPAGVTARIKFTNRLFPSGALLGNVGSALMSGASGRLWLTNDGRGRIELQSNAGDVQIVWNSSNVSIYDASSNTVYRVSLPAHKSDATSSTDKSSLPALSEIDKLLSEFGAHATISAAQPANIAGRPAYTVSLSPKHDGGLLASTVLAWDAEHGVPLRVAIFAQGSSAPVLELTVTDISYGSVPSSDVSLQPPTGAHVVDLSTPAGHDTSSGKTAPVTGLADVQAAAGFTVSAPATLVGLPRKDVRLVGSAESKAALVVYGQGLGAIIVVERKADAAAQNNGVLSSLPTVSLNGITAHELATQLGTVLEWRAGGTAYVLAGSLPAAAAEAAARQLK
jgi:outer membrane lipoprotein-sorting protein